MNDIKLTISPNGQVTLENSGGNVDSKLMDQITQRMGLVTDTYQTCSTDEGPNLETSISV